MIPLGRRPVQVAQKTPPFPYHPVERMSGVPILGIQLKMLR